MRACIGVVRASRRALWALLARGISLMALRNVFILRKPPTGPAFGRPEDRLHGCLEGRMALNQPLANSFTASEIMSSMSTGT
jgi:hypothetical protein